MIKPRRNEALQKAFETMAKPLDNKDNPVPSLTKREKEVLLECLEIANEQHGDDPSKEEIASLISKINGVETNKVQPKKQKKRYVQTKGRVDIIY